MKITPIFISFTGIYKCILQISPQNVIIYDLSKNFKMAGKKNGQVKNSSTKPKCPDGANDTL